LASEETKDSEENETSEHGASWKNGPAQNKMKVEEEEGGRN